MTQGRKRSLSRLRHMVERSFNEIADWAPAILWVTDPGGACIYLSRGWYEYTGQTPDQGLGFGWVSAVHPADREPSAAIFLRANEERIPFTLDYRLRRHDGAYRWAIDAGNPRFAEDGEYLGFVGSVLDITERKAAEESLRGTEARLRRLVETAAEGIWIVDADGATTYVNQRMAAMLGYRPDDMVGRRPTDFTADEVSRANTERALISRRTGASDVRETRLRHRDGSILWVLVKANPIHDESGAYEGALGMLTDITEHKELERRLIQSQKMEAIGRLAGGVAHDFNNLLTAIGGHARLVADELPDGSPARADLLEVERGVERATALTRQLLTFSRPDAGRPDVVDLNPLVTDFERMLRRTLGADIALDVRRDDDVPPVRVDAVQIEQVLLNLANNARDAMPSGGTLVIETCRMVVDDLPRGMTPPAGDEFAALIVRDAGSGMDENTREHVFEPFFTTKAVGKGSGLGLSTVHGIVTQAGGAIHLSTSPGTGSTFTSVFPAADAAPVPETMREPEEEPPRGNERVLIVEDEDPVRRLAARVLARLGYSVVEATNADEALRHLENGVVIDLVLTDLVMPGLSGRDLHRRVSGSGNHVPFMFMSGYSPEESLPDAAASAGVPFLEKPFRTDELARAVRAAIDRTTAG